MGCVDSTSGLEIPHGECESTHLRPCGVKFACSHGIPTNAHAPHRTDRRFSPVRSFLPRRRRGIGGGGGDVRVDGMGLGVVCGCGVCGLTVVSATGVWATSRTAAVVWLYAARLYTNRRRLYTGGRTGLQRIAYRPALPVRNHPKCVSGRHLQFY